MANMKMLKEFVLPFVQMEYSITLPVFLLVLLVLGTMDSKDVFNLQVDSAQMVSSNKAAVVWLLAQVGPSPIL